MKEALHTVEEYILKADCNTDKSSFHSLMEGILKKAGVEKSIEFAENIASRGILLNDFFYAH